MKRFCLMVLSLTLLSLAFGATTLSASGHGNEVIIPGKVVTGFNRYLGQPHAEFGGIGLLGFPEVAQYNPEGTAPIPLTPETPGSALLATFVDPAFMGLNGLPPADPELLNVPLREVGTNLDLADIVRTPVEGHFHVPLYEDSQAEPSDPIDLATWIQARGFVSVTCTDDGRADFLLAARNLLPNRLYSVFGFFFPGPPERPLIVQPLGGMPNGFVTDGDGRGSIRRTLKRCPFETPEGEPGLFAIDLQYHSDHMLNGAHPSLPQKGGGLAVGSITHAHLEFVFSGQELLQPEGWGDDSCVPGQTTHCLQDGRFKVEVTWTDFVGQSGPGRTVDFGSDDSGSFYFFDRDNHEMVVKVLDGCDFNQHFWVFASSATDVAYELTVTDTRTNDSRTYQNELGNPAPAITDTSAFATCP